MLVRSATFEERQATRNASIAIWAGHPPRRCPKVLLRRSDGSRTPEAPPAPSNIRTSGESCLVRTTGDRVHPSLYLLQRKRISRVHGDRRLRRTSAHASMRVRGGGGVL